MKDIPHTPGPWRWSVGNGYNSGVYVLRGEDEICEVFYDCDTEALPDKANAALIAAAPDLLEALRGLLSQQSFSNDRAWWVKEQEEGRGDAPLVIAAIDAILKASPNLSSASLEGETNG